MKQRLIGASLIVALVVLFVPMLFDEAPGRATVASDADEAALPTPVEEVSAGPGDSSDSAEPGDRTEGDEPGYRIIPLTDGSNVEAPSRPASDPASAGAASAPAEFVGDEGADDIQVPTPDSPLGAAAGGGRGAPVAADKPSAGKSPDSADRNTHSRAPAGTNTGGPTGSKVSGASATDRNAAPASPISSSKAAKKGAAEREPSSGRTESVKDGAATANASRLGAKPTSAQSASGPGQKNPDSKPSDSASGSAQPRQTKTSSKQKPEAPAKLTTAALKPVAKDNPPGASSETAKPKPPTQVKSVVARKPATDSPTTRWVVHTSSFTSEASAKALVEKLRKNKFAAFIEPVQGQAGTNYRVSIGPEAEKDQAEKARKRLEATVGLSGTVTPRK